jgi:hypothetical protein
MGTREEGRVMTRRREGGVMKRSDEASGRSHRMAYGVAAAGLTAALGRLVAQDLKRYVHM